MRGEVIDYAAGAGLISGEDGRRYSFTDTDLPRGGRASVGAQVDFVPEGDKASQIYLLGAPRRFETTDEDLSLWDYFVKCMRLYASGEGRARRKEYWSFVLFSTLFSVAGFIALAVVIATITAVTAAVTGGEMRPFGLFHWLFVLAIFVVLVFFLIPRVAVFVRRLHDVGLSGWFALLLLIPGIGGLFALIIALMPSQEGENRYGLYPKPRAPYTV